LDYGEQGAPRPKYFYFEKQWLMQPGIYDLVRIKTQESDARRPNNGYSLDSWHGSLCYLRRVLEGWNLQKIGEQKQTKKVLLQQLSALDAAVEDGPLPADHWQQRYEIENKLKSIYNLEEIHCQQKGSELWVLKGDSNTDFFHAFANGRRRKKTIIELETDQGVVKSQEEIMKHVTGFYKNLFGSQPQCNLRLDKNFWIEGRTLPQGEKENLIKPFLEEEVKKTIFEMRVDSAPGPNGFDVQFFKTFCPVIKGDYMAMLHDFHKRELDIKRLNFGVITLVPKLKEANSIKQYCLICLLNVDYKVATIMLFNRLSPLTKEVIGDNQIGFIKGKNILEGVVVLHEVIHELKRSKSKGLILKIDFEKAYDKVRWDFLEEVMRGKDFPS
jgi:hypothetical protein